MARLTPGRAYSCWLGESVTRSDRRRRELDVQKPVSAARPPARIDGAIAVQGFLLRVQEPLCLLGFVLTDSCFANYRKFLLCFIRDTSISWSFSWSGAAGKSRQDAPPCCSVREE